MADPEIEKPNSQTGDEVEDQDLDLNDIVLDDEDDEEDIESVKGKNKQLFARLMKAEGKVKDPETGKWVKQAPKEEPAKPEEKPKPKPSEKQSPPANVTLTEDDVDARLEAKLFKRDLDALDVSEEIRGEIKKYAQSNNLSVTQAANSKYINFLKGEEAEKKKIEDATISKKQKSFAKADFADAKPSDFDLSTAEGREQWGEYKKWLKDQ